MANNVIILGNGFDLDLGLNTSFKSFCESTYFRSLPNISFIKDLRTNNWSDVEGCIRKHLVEYSKSPNEELAKKINLLWQGIEYNWGIFLPEQIELEYVTINKDSCAYTFLGDSNIKAQWISFNYTHPRYLCGELDGEEPICIHNDCVERDFAKQHKLAFYIPKNLIIGVDSSMPNNVLTNHFLSPIVKKKNSSYNSSIDIPSLSSEAKRIVLFGHSLGITDSDYFKEFFLRCIDNTYSGKTIFIVTLNEKSLNNIKENLYSYDIDYDKLRSSSNELITIYTETGVSKEFKNMMASLY